MTSIRVSLVTSLLVGTLLAVGCGKTTRLGQVRPDTDGGAAGAFGDAGASGEAGAAGGSTTGGASAGGSAGSAAGARCQLPMPAPIPNPTPAALERARLIHDYCVTLARDNCLEISGTSFVYQQTKGCSIEDRIAACEQDRLYEYIQHGAPACEGEWRAVVGCLAAEIFDTTECSSASVFGTSPDQPCNEAKSALSECQRNNSAGRSSVAGARATCDYGMGALGAFGNCQVTCRVGPNWFSSECGGPDGLPIRCSCMVNRYAAGDWAGIGLYASDCRDAATRMANGEWCTDLLDCCLKYVENGKERCVCGSSQGCAEAAAGLGATVVAMCPQYEPLP